MEPPIHADAHRSNWDALAEVMIGCAFKVLNESGCGFLEKVYENATVHELKKARLTAEPQKAIPVYYDGVMVGDYYAGISVNGIVLIELKAVKAFDEIHKAQCMNYLKATRLPICLLMNFGATRLGLKRLVGETYPAGESQQS